MLIYHSVTNPVGLLWLGQELNFDPGAWPEFGTRKVSLGALLVMTLGGHLSSPLAPLFFPSSCGHLLPSLLDLCSILHGGSFLQSHHQKRPPEQQMSAL